MIAGLYTAANGLVAIERMQSATANNIANSSTNGFKSHTPANEGFYEVFMTQARGPGAFRGARAPGGGVRVAETYNNYRQGTLQLTGDPLHIALEGPGFLAVDTAEGERFTRDGALTVDTEGHLATHSGHKLQNVTGGYIDARGGRIEIDPEGNVFIDRVPAGQVRVLEFADPQALQRAGDNLYLAPQDAIDQAEGAAATRVLQSSLEASNVDIPREMINLMLGTRAYEANHRSILAADETISRLIDQVGMPR
jgi:flagellar basal-body rod protein FlgG